MRIVGRKSQCSESRKLKEKKRMISSSLPIYLAKLKPEKTNTKLRKVFIPRKDIVRMLVVGKEGEADYRSRKVPLLHFGSQYHSYSLQWPSSDSFISSIRITNTVAPGRECEKVSEGNWKYWKQFSS